MVTKAEISLVRSLADKKGRAEHGLFVAEGPKLVAEALASGLRVGRIYGLPEMACAGDFRPASHSELERMSALRTPQGILALIEIPRRPMPSALGEELTLALDGIQDPGNMGTILRIADWFGIREVVCSPDTADCYNPKAVQASMGAVLRVSVHYGPLVELLAGVNHIYGAMLEGDNIYTADLGPRPAGVLVMGNEGNGISPAVAATLTRKLHIPPYPPGTPTSESLNVAAATAIICSELRRRG